jgi:hypothetical protein
LIYSALPTAILATNARFLPESAGEVL